MFSLWIFQPALEVGKKQHLEAQSRHLSVMGSVTNLEKGIDSLCDIIIWLLAKATSLGFFCSYKRSFAINSSLACIATLLCNLCYFTEVFVCRK